MNKKTISTYPTDEELQRIKARANADSRSISSYLKHLIKKDLEASAA